MIKVAGDNSFPPFEFLQNGTYQGFNVDILNSVSIETGVSFEFHPMPWNEALQALEKGEVDAIQGMKYSRERAKIYEFSLPYFTSAQGIFVRKQNYSIFSPRDLADHKISVQRGDISGEVLRHVNKVQMFQVENQEEAIQLLLDGQVDAFVGNQITGQYVLQRSGQYDQVKIVGEPIDPTDYGLVVLKRNKHLLKTINEGIREIKQNGTYEKIERKWFGAYIYPPSFPMREMMTYVLVGVIVVSGVLLIILWWNFTLKKELKKRIDDYKKTMDELARKDRLQSLGQLVAGIAHEIRNPITTILSYSQLLPQKYDNPEYREYFSEHVTEEVRRLNKLINDLLDFARQRPPARTEFQLLEVLKAVQLYFQPMLKEKNIQVRLDVAAPLLVWADPQQIKQVFINLLKNAIDAMNSGGTLDISAKFKQDYIEVIIRDSGEGIDPDDVSKVFEPFFTRKAEGVGLGLSICYRLMEENAGSIEVRSEKGMGTTVILQLPSAGERT
ncbi:transporter substrate-binding domain-containing protein [Brevibacillus sp. H7]|uniref:transporter substrate-binding domain-containing protein n=1 Tax=Brevibacillus sp. H7 TaxID=3349138 RepID=UPI003816F43E